MNLNVGVLNLRWGNYNKDKQKCILIRYYQGDEIKEDKMGRTRMHGKDAK